MNQETLEKQELRSKSPEEETLESGDIEKNSPLKGYSYLEFVKIKDDGSGIFKREEEDKKEVNRERAAYLVNLFLGFDFVPPTVLRRIGEKYGSVQQFIENGKVASMVQKEDIPKEELLKLNIFDYIINNGDRHKKNYLIRDGKIVAIDHGVAFSYYSGLSDHSKANWSRTMGVAISQEIKDKLALFVSSESKGRILKDLLYELIDEKNVKLIFKRAEAIHDVISKDGSVSQTKLDDLSSGDFFK